MADEQLQRKAFKEYYCNPESETFGLIKQSAMKAGYSESYAKVLMSDSTGNAWINEVINDSKLLAKAERNLDTLLDEEDDKKVKADITKFVAKTLGKRKYSERHELSGPDGAPLEDPKMTKLTDKLLADYLNDKSTGNVKEGEEE